MKERVHEVSEEVKKVSGNMNLKWMVNASRIDRGKERPVRPPPYIAPSSAMHHAEPSTMKDGRRAPDNLERDQEKSSRRESINCLIEQHRNAACY